MLIFSSSRMFHPEQGNNITRKFVNLFIDFFHKNPFAGLISQGKYGRIKTTIKVCVYLEL